MKLLELIMFLILFTLGTALIVVLMNWMRTVGG